MSDESVLRFGGDDGRCDDQHGHGRRGSFTGGIGHHAGVHAVVGVLGTEHTVGGVSGVKDWHTPEKPLIGKEESAGGNSEIQRLFFIQGDRRGRGGRQDLWRCDDTEGDGGAGNDPTGVAHTAAVGAGVAHIGSRNGEAGTGCTTDVHKVGRDLFLPLVSEPRSSRQEIESSGISEFHGDADRLTDHGGGAIDEQCGGIGGVRARRVAHDAAVLAAQAGVHVGEQEG